MEEERKSLVPYHKELFRQTRLMFPLLTDERITDEERSLGYSLFFKLEQGGMKEEDIFQVAQAANLVSTALAGEKRFSGEAKATHSYHVAHILADAGFVRDNRHKDWEIIAAALLHDVPEDTSEESYGKPAISLDHIRIYFGDNVASLVEALTAVKGKKHPDPDPITHLKILQSLNKDPRAILIKLADRLHNMATIKHLPKDVQIRKCEETLKIYVPIARQNSLHQWADILAEQAVLALSRLQPDKFSSLSSFLQERSGLYNPQALEDLSGQLKQVLSNYVSDISVTPPSIAEYYQNISKEHPNPPATIACVIREPTTHLRDGVDPISFMVNNCLNTLHAHFGTIMEEASLLDLFPQNSDFISLVMVMPDGKKFRLIFFTKEEYDMQTASLLDFYFDQSPYHPCAVEKLKLLKSNLRTITSLSKLPQSVVTEFLAQPEQPLFITVVNEKPIVLPQGATVADAVIACNGHLASRLKIESLSLTRDKKSETCDLSTPLRPNDKISFVYHPRNQKKTIEPWWLDAARTPYAQRAIRDNLRLIIRKEKEQMEKPITEQAKKRGVRIFNQWFETQFAARRRVSIANIKKAINDFLKKIGTRNFLYPDQPILSFILAIGLNQLPQTEEVTAELKNLLSLLYSYQSSLVPLSCRVNNQPGIAGIIGQTLGENGINICALDHDQDPASLEKAVITYWFEPGENDANLLIIQNKVIPALAQKLNLPPEDLTFGKDLGLVLK